MRRSLISVLICFICLPVLSQEVADTIATPKIPSKYFDVVNKKTESISRDLDKRSQKALARMQSEEVKLKKRLSKIDSIAANNLFATSIEKYTEFQQKLTQKAEKIGQLGINNYIPYLDTLKNTISFLQKNGEKYSEKFEELSEKFTGISDNINNLEERLSQLKDIQQYFKERRMYLKQQLSKYGMDKYLKKMSKEVYYAGQLINDYKEILKDPKKIEQKTLAILRDVPAFKKFMQKNSMLASIFRIPSDNSFPSSLTGLQTRASVQQYLQTSMPLNGGNSQQFLTQQMQYANSQMAAMKNIPQLSACSDNLGEVPDFKPNSQKTKPFLKRLEYSVNMQFGSVNNLMPTLANFSFGIGYKLNDNGLIGIGTSYKLGLGSNIKNIHFTHEGYGIRTYIDWQVKYGFYISGGYEKNCFPELRDVELTTRTSIVRADYIQESGLVGITKKYPISKRAKGSAQLLFDFLSYKNIPKSQPILVRFGWSF
jgi:hypothetical protein